MKLNVTALNFWAFCSLATYFFGHRTLNSGLAGFWFGLGISLTVAFVDEAKPSIKVFLSALYVGAFAYLAWTQGIPQ